MEKSNMFMGSDNWWIENDKAWFVEVTNNILCCLNLNTNECELMVCIPDTNPSTFRLTPYCIKYGKNIFCLPGCGECIWVYDLQCEQFSRIDIDNPEKCQLAFDFWIHNNRIFAISGELKKIIEINMNQKKIENYYTIFEESSWAKSVRVGNKIYSLPTKTNKIYQFDLISKSIEEYSLPDIGRKLYTLCYDGKKFWMSGYGKEIYTWDIESNNWTRINGFPQDFGVYNFNKNVQEILDYETDIYDFPTFLFSVAAGEYIWFIPFQTNKIICIDQKDYKLSSFTIDEEDETKESLSLGNRMLPLKYLLEYVKDNRYIGLFSFKNNRILEIDAAELTYQWVDYYLSDKCLLWYGAKNRDIYHEESILDRLAYIMKVQNTNYNVSCAVENNFGLKIYKA